MTIAWLQRAIVLGSLLFWWGLGAWAFGNARGWAALCFAAPVLITPVILGIQCFWAARVNRSDASIQSASLSQWLFAWQAECMAAARVFMWWQPFRYAAIADDVRQTPGKRGVVLVHGFFCNRALWMDWIGRLQNEQRALVAVDLEPVFGTISDYASVIEAAIVKVEQATGLPPLIIGHSMGGLAIRAWAAQFIGKHGAMSRIHRIITIGTPHQGTAIAVFSHTKNGSEMRQSSSWLEGNAACLPDNFAKHCTCYYSHCDNIVFPATTATLPGADNQHIAGHAHVQLIFSKNIQQACLGHLET